MKIAISILFLGGFFFGALWGYGLGKDTKFDLEYFCIPLLLLTLLFM